RSKVSLVGGCDEVLQAHDANLIRIGEVSPEFVTDIELAKTPARSTEHQVGSHVPAAQHGLCKTDDFKWNLLLCSPGNLLPFHRNQPPMAVSLCDCIHVVTSTSWARTDVNLGSPLIAAAVQGGQHHLFQN